MKSSFYFFSGVVLTLVVVLFSFGKSDSQNDVGFFSRRESEVNNSFSNLYSSNWKLLELIEIKSKNDSSNMDSIINLAKRIDKHKSELTSFLQQQRGKIIADIDGISSFQGDTLSIRLIQNPLDKKKTKTFLFGNGIADSSSCLAHQIALKLSEFEREANSMIALSYRSSELIRLPGFMYDFSSDKFVQWEQYKFQNNTLAETIVTFKEVEMSCLIAENRALEALLKKKYVSRKSE
jgi:hypothetical protein